MELVFALALLLLAALSWLLLLRRWEAAFGALLALLGTLPLLFLLLGGSFRWSAALLCVLSVTAGGLVVAIALREAH